MIGKFQSERNEKKYLRIACDGSPTLVGVDDASEIELDGNVLKAGSTFLTIQSLTKDTIAFAASPKPGLLWDEAQGEIVVSGRDGCLDIYDKNSEHVTMWQRNGHKNQKWRWVPSASLGVADNGALMLRDVNDQPRPFRVVANGGKWKCPVFFSEDAQLTTKQRRPQPVLVMSESDWNYVKDPKVTHEGAFGRDIEVWTKPTIKQRRAQGIGIAEDRWVLVWKFPGDLNHLPGYSKICDVPLPVGAYPFYDDKWFVPPDRQLSHPDLPIDKVAVEKLRIDKAKGGSIHVLESVDNGVQVAMIGSHYFIEQLWGETEKERKNLSAMLAALYQEGIYAVPCYGQHHAIVFYIDLKKNALISPKALPALLQNPRVFDLLKKHSRASTQQLTTWRDDYASQVF